MKKILITGANSYIGESVKQYLLQYPDYYDVATVNTLGWNPVPEDFNGYDVVFNVAGIAHIRETKDNKQLYFDINRDLVIKIAKMAKKGGINQFIQLSSMSVYGLNEGYITKTTQPKPVSAYGESKLQADEKIAEFADDTFKFACLRPPMVYGKGCKGNYVRLRSFALKCPIFPNYQNERSMIYIGNLCEFVKTCIDYDKRGLFFPQNAEYINTSKMVSAIAQANNKKITKTRLLNWIIKLLPFSMIKKVFGDLTYEHIDLVGKYSFEDSIRISEE